MRSRKRKEAFEGWEERVVSQTKHDFSGYEDGWLEDDNKMGRSEDEEVEKAFSKARN